MPEPHGHRGHPTSLETLRARKLRPRLIDAINRLEFQGWTFGEAVSFIAGAAWEIGGKDGETWSGADSARLTVTQLTNGRAAKLWSIGLLHRVLNDLEGAL